MKNAIQNIAKSQNGVLPQISYFIRIKAYSCCTVIRPRKAHDCNRRCILLVREKTLENIATVRRDESLPIHVPF